MQKRGTFRKTVAGIKNVLRAEVPLAVHMVISRENEGHVYETGKFVAGLGVKSFAATKVSPSLGSPVFPEISLSKELVRRSLDDLLALRRDFGLRTGIMECYPLCLIGDAQKYGSLARKKCVAGVTTMVVGAEGNIRPCIHSDEVVGNIFEDGLKESWARMGKWRDGSLIPENCKGCGSLQDCTAGCRVEAQYFGNIAGMDPYASGPSDVLIPAGRGTLEEKLERLDGKAFVLNPRLKMRREDFGGIVHVRGGGNVFLNRDSYNWIQSIGGDKFLVEGDRDRGFFSYLLRRKVIMPHEE